MRVKTTLIRLFRGLAALFLAGAVARYQNDPRYVAAAPFLGAGGKWLRENYPDRFTWLPF